MPFNMQLMTRAAFPIWSWLRTSHNYQRIERSLVKGKSTPFLVVGHGGYYHLHNLNAAPGDTDPNTEARLIAANDKQHGYATTTVDKKNISGSMSTVDTPKASGKKDGPIRSPIRRPR